MDVFSASSFTSPDGVKIKKKLFVLHHHTILKQCYIIKLNSFLLQEFMYDRNIRNTRHLFTIYWKVVQENIFSTYLKWSCASRSKFNNVRSKYSIVKLHFIPPYLNLKIVRVILIASVNVLDIYWLGLSFFVSCAVDQLESTVFK